MCFYKLRDKSKYFFVVIVRMSQMFLPDQAFNKQLKSINVLILRVLEAVYDGNGQHCF